MKIVDTHYQAHSKISRNVRYYIIIITNNKSTTGSKMEKLASVSPPTNIIIKSKMSVLQFPGMI